MLHGYNYVHELCKDIHCNGGIIQRRPGWHFLSENHLTKKKKKKVATEEF